MQRKFRFLSCTYFKFGPWQHSKAPLYYILFHYVWIKYTKEKKRPYGCVVLNHKSIKTTKSTTATHARVYTNALN